MTSLEDELGAKLFVREPNRIRLSEAGRAFQEDADDILRAYDAAAEHVARIEGRNKPTFRVGYLPDGGMRYLSLLTRVLTESSPECSLKYQAAEFGVLEKLLAEDQIDIAITLSNPRVAPRLKLERVHLERVAYYAALSRRHPLAGREAISLDELTELPIIFPDPDAMGSMYQNFCCALEARERGIPENLHYVDIPSLVFQIESTNGASLVFEIHRERYRDLIACLPVTGLKQVSYIAVEWKAQTEERLAGDWPERLKGIPGAVS